MAFAVAAWLAFVPSPAAASLPQIPVLTTSAGEFQPARSDNALAWEQNTRARPNQYDVMVQEDGSAPVRANRPGTSAAMGDFAGSQLFYQQYKGNPHTRGRSDILIFDIMSGARSKVPGVNTRQWEYWPSRSGNWLLYGRWKPKNEVRRLFLLHLETGERRLLDKTKGAKKFIGPGQVQGNFAVWSTCRPRCNVFRYDIAADAKQMIDNPGFFQRAPSVTPAGTVYFSRGTRGCGGSVALIRSRPDGEQEVLVQLQQGLDIRDTYAYVEANGTVEVYYERNACRTKAGSDIYKVRDMALVPLEVTKEGTGSGTVSSSPPGISCGADCSENFEAGTEVTLTAVPHAGSVFVGWDGHCSGTAACTLLMDTTKAVTATFLPLGSVTILKDSIPNDPQVFGFDPDASLSPPFSLTDNGDPASFTEVITGVDPGVYVIREDAVAGWRLTNITCEGADHVVSLVNRRVTVDLGPNEAVLCTFENTKDARILVTNQTNPDGSSQLFTFTRSYGANFTLADGQTHNSGFLAPGSYSVQEVVPAGWQLTGTVCTDGSTPGSIVLSPGETVTCTFTNTQNGQIRVTKQTDPNGSSQSFTFNRSYGGPFALTDGQTNDSGSTLSPGVYSVTESVPSGWDLTSATCNDGSTPGSINLSAGETVTCTFNNRQSGKILVTKQTTPDGSSQQFGFSSDYGNFSLQDGQTNDSGFLDPGTYSVSEITPSGWELSGATCSDGSTPGSISLSAGETVMCTFNNRQNGRILVTKQTTPDGSAQSFDFSTDYGPDFTLSDGQTNDSGFTLDPGTYSVSENPVPGWELTGATCSDGSAPGNIGVAAGETVSCTFQNSEQGAIIVAKETTPDGSTQSFMFDPDYGPNFPLQDGQTNNSGALDPGTYSVSEITPSGWDLTSATCSDGSTPGSISLSAGETVTCTFSNRQDGRIVVAKQTLPDGSSQDFTFTRDYGTDFTLSDGQSNDSGFTLDPGTYSVSENPVPGWELTSATCSDGSAPGNIGVAAGETVTCTFQNTEKGSITIALNSMPDDPQDFDFSAPGLVPSAFTLDDDDTVILPPPSATPDTHTFSGVSAGTYSVVETVPLLWQLDSIVCVDPDDGSSSNTGTATATVDLDPGETVTCTFTNSLL